MIGARLLHNSKSTIRHMHPAEAMFAEAMKAEDDMMNYGIGIMKDGERVDPWDFYIDVSKGTDDE